MCTDHKAHRRANYYYTAVKCSPNSLGEHGNAEARKGITFLDL